MTRVVPEWSSLTVGPVTRTDIVRYAGAGGDFNPVHHDDVYARSLGLPGVFAMGLLGAGHLSRLVTKEFGVGAVKRFTVRFGAQVWPGESLNITIDSVDSLDEGGDQLVRLSARNEDGQLKISAEAVVARQRMHPQVREIEGNR
jgi:acyl dehydratase